MASGLAIIGGIGQGISQGVKDVVAVRGLEHMGKMEELEAEKLKISQADFGLRDIESKLKQAEWTLKEKDIKYQQEILPISQIAADVNDADTAKGLLDFARSAGLIQKGADGAEGIRRVDMVQVANNLKDPEFLHGITQGKIEGLRKQLKDETLTSEATMQIQRKIETLEDGNKILSTLKAHREKIAQETKHHTEMKELKEKEIAATLEMKKAFYDMRSGSLADQLELKKNAKIQQATTLYNNSIANLDKEYAKQKQDPMANDVVLNDWYNSAIKRHQDSFAASIKLIDPALNPWGGAAESPTGTGKGIIGGTQPPAGGSETDRLSLRDKLPKKGADAQSQTVPASAPAPTPGTPPVATAPTTAPAPIIQPSRQGAIVVPAQYRNMGTNYMGDAIMDVGESAIATADELGTGVGTGWYDFQKGLKRMGIGVGWNP